MASTLTSDQVGTHPSITLEWPCTHIWSCENTSHGHIRTTLSPKTEFSWYLTRQLHSKNGNSPSIWSCRNQSYSHIRQENPTLTSDHVGTHPTTLSKRPSTHIWQPMSEMPSTYIWPCEEPILCTCRKGSALIFDHVGTNPTVASKWHSVLDWVFLVTD